MFPNTAETLPVSGLEEAIFKWSGQLTLSITHAACDLWRGLGAAPQGKFLNFGPQIWLLVSFRGK